MQAAGRVIRTEEDRGMILLLDERYTYRSYEKLLPRDWQPIPVTVNSFKKTLEKQWDKIKEQP